MGLAASERVETANGLSTGRCKSCVIPMRTGEDMLASKIAEQT
jgi:hypothetical protein